MTELAATDLRALLDSLRQVTGDGSERWSGRDMQSSLEYAQWRQFELAIDRARAACANVGEDPDHHFAGARKVTEGGRWGTHTVPDYLMTRYGAYLLAMNGDPRKPIIAEMQTYFATQTRIAETAMPEQRPAPRRELSNRELAAMVLEEADRADAAEEGRLAEAEQRRLEAARAEQAEAKALELEPAAAAWEHSRETGEDEEVADAAKWLCLNHGVQTGQYKLHYALRQMCWTYYGNDGKVRATQRAINANWLVQRDREYFDERLNEWVEYPQVRVMKDKGRAALLRRLDDIERHSAEYSRRKDRTS